MNRTIISQFQIYWVVKKPSGVILQAVFNWRHLYANWQFSWDILSLIKSLLENRNCDRSEDLSFTFFQLKRIFCLCLRHLNLTMTRFRFSKWWHECSCSEVTLTPVRDKSLQTFSSKISSPRLSGIGLFQLFLFCDIENLSPHSFPAESFFVIDDYYNFVISAILSRLSHILTQNRWTFQWVLKVLMTHTIIWAVLQQARLYSCFPFDF